MTLAMIEKPVDLDQAFEVALEGEIRELIRRDGASLRRGPRLTANRSPTTSGPYFNASPGLQCRRSMA